MIALALPSNETLVPLLGRTEKREGVEALILSYAQGHAVMDVLIGALGFIPVPGAGLAAMVGAIGVQGPAIYQPMARQIAEIYGRQPGTTERAEVLRGAIGGGLRDAAVAFGVDFFTEIAGELAQEMGLGGILSVIPFFGGFVGMYFDVKIAWTMTWRVGLMLALYHENGGEWVISRKHTYELVKERIKLDKDHGQPPPSIQQIVAGTPEIKKSQAASVNMVAQMLLEQGLTTDDVRKSLADRKIPTDLIDAVLAHL